MGWGDGESEMVCVKMKTEIF